MTGGDSATIVCCCCCRPPTVELTTMGVNCFDGGSRMTLPSGPIDIDFD